jgi:hypothetical protein
VFLIDALRSFNAHHHVEKLGIAVGGPEFDSQGRSHRSILTRLETNGSTLSAVIAGRARVS